jgi:hypothetical protein
MKGVSGGVALQSAVLRQSHGAKWIVPYDQTMEQIAFPIP